MLFFHKSSEDYLKQIIRITANLKNDIDKQRYDRATKFLEKILSIDISLYEEIELDTGSKALKEYALYVRGQIVAVLEECKKGEYSKLPELMLTIINAGTYYLDSKEKFVGYSVEEKELNIIKQSRFISDTIEGMTNSEALIILLISYTYGLNVIIGGSSFKNHAIGGDIDIGFTNSDAHLSKEELLYIHKLCPDSKTDKILTHLISVAENKPHTLDIALKVNTVINKINKFALSWFQSKFNKPLIRDKFIYSGYEGMENSIPPIMDPGEFFFRRGFRSEKRSNLAKDGKPFGPSGYLQLMQNGKTLFVTPIYSRGIVGESVFWKN